MKSKKPKVEEQIRITAVAITDAVNARLASFEKRITACETDTRSQCRRMLPLHDQLESRVSALTARVKEAQFVLELLSMKPKSKWMRFALWVDSLIGGNK